MASTQTWSEFNGAGQTETTNRAECNWKNVDDSTTAYSSSVITAGNNSFTKYQCIVFAGTWNSLSALTYKIDNNAPATGISIKANTKTTYATPSTTASGDAAASTSGESANFGTSAASSAFTAGTTSTTASGTCYTNPWRTQLQTTSSAGPGDIATRTITATWTES
jgi:hypothetical protein